MRGSTFSLLTVLILAAAAAVAIAAPQDASLPDAGRPAVGDAGADGEPGPSDAGLTSDADPPPDGDAEFIEMPDGDLFEDEDVEEDDWLEPTEEFQADRAWIFIDKSERRLVAQDGRGWRETFRVALGFEPVGDKEIEGDGRTPEGEFYVCSRVRHDRFHRFLGLSYPAPEDAHRGKALGLLMPIEFRSILRAWTHREPPPWRTALGGKVGIHGYGRRSDRAALHAAGEDWTDGCIAVSNDEIERIHGHIRVGTRVVIVP